MASPDHLHKLIASLSKNEKGYFRKMSTGLGQQANNYIRLFDAIRKQKAYDEAALKKKFAGQKFVRNFSMAKSYLTDAILRSLRNYYAAEDPQKYTGELIDNVRICFEKGLYDTGLSSLKKGKAIALKNDLFYQYLILLDFEINRHNHFQLDASAYIAEKTKVLDYLRVNHELATLSARILSISLRYRNSRTDEEAYEVNAILEACLHYDRADQPLVNRHKARETIANCYAINGQRDKAYQVKYETLAIYENLPDQIRARPVNYLKLLSNVLALAAETQPVKTFNTLYTSIPQRLSYCPGSAQLKQEITVRFGLVYYLKNNNEKQAIEFAETNRRFITQSSAIAEGRRLELYFMIASACHTLGNLAQAMRWLRLLTEHPALYKKEWLRKASMLHELFLFYDQGKTDLLENRLYAIERNKAGQQKLLPFEKNLFEFLRNVVILQPIHVKKSFALMHEEMQQVLHDPKQRNQIMRTDLMQWLAKHAEIKKD